MIKLLALALAALLSLALLPAPLALPQAPVANAGPDRTVFVNEVVALDGTGSTGVFDGWRTDSDQYSITWDFGYGGWTYMGGLTAPTAYPKPGVYTVTLVVCNAAGACSSDTAQVTVNGITEGSVTTVADTGNPVTNATNLCNAITTLASADNPVIQVTAGVIYRRPPSSACILPNRTGAGYLTIRSSAHAMLPNATTRVFPTDAANMAIMETGVHINNANINSSEAVFRANAGDNPAHHYRFIGLHFRKTFPTLDYVNPRAFIDLGNGSPTSLAQLPHHFQIDRNFIDGGNTTAGTTRGVILTASDAAVVNNYMYRIQGIGIEVQAILINSGERLAALNNFLQATTENMMSGGADVSIRVTEGTAQSTGNDSTHIKLAASASAVNNFYAGMGINIASGTGAQVGPPCPCSNTGRTITAYDGTTKIATVSPAFQTTPDGTSVYRIGSHVPTNVVVRRNHMAKDICWQSSQPCYYGVNMVVKNIFEIKQGKQWAVQGNRFEHHWMEDQNWAMTFTIRNQDGRQPWAKISYVDFAHNKIFKVGNCFQFVTSDNLNFSLGMDHFTVRHAVCSGVSFYEGSGGFRNFAHISDGGSSSTPDTFGDRLSFMRASTDQEGFDGRGRAIDFEGTTRLTNFTFSGNITQGLFMSSTGSGTAAFVAATGGGAGSYSAVKNGWYLSSGTNPAGNSTTATRASVGFTDIATQNLLLTGLSPFLTTGIAGGRSGADIGAVNTLTVGCETGQWPDAAANVTIGGKVVLGGKVND